MRARIGIELTPVACRVVELEGPSIVPGQPPATRVRSYDVLPPSGPETGRRLAALGRRPVAVVLWGVRSDHRQVVVSNGSYERKRTEALAAARSAGVDTRGTLADVATASTAIKGADRQPVVLALAGADDVSAAVRPLRDAGVRIRSVITPADALLGLARSRKAFAVPGGIEAYVALDETATCVALVRDGSLLAARELPWGFVDGTGAAPSTAAELTRRDDLAARLVAELTEFLGTVGADGSALAQVSVCGGLPELRTMTVSLMERLDVEVEALDSLFGIDVERLPDPADEFREQVSALRLAWAAAADWRGPIDLMRHRRRRSRRIAVARAAVFAGVIAGLSTGWAIQQSAWWQSTTPQVARREPAAAPPVNLPAPAQAAAPRPATPSVTAPAPPASGPAPPPSASAATPPPSNTPARPPVTTQPVTPAVGRSTAPAAAPVPPARPPAAPQVATPPPTPLPAVARPPAATPPVVRVAPPVPQPAAPAPVPPARQPAPAAPSPVTPPIGRPALRQQPAEVPPATVAVAPPAVTAPAAPRAAVPSPSTGTALVRAGTEGNATASRPAQPAARRPGETPVPLEAVLGTILYSPDRKLAIVNSRIVGLGDAVNGARIVDITPGAVMLRDAQGRLRSLTLGAVDRVATAP